MAVIEAGAALLSAVKSAADIVRDVRNSRDPAKLRDAINDLTAHLSDALSSVIDLQAENAALHHRLREAQARNGKRDTFEEQAERYVRKPTSFGGVIYVEKGTPEEEARSAKFCAHCFENGKRSILNPLGMRQFKCAGCGAQQKM